MSKRLMICAGEASGELYGALLSREIKKKWHDAEITGIGGSCMKEAGVKLIAPISSAIGIIEVIKHLKEIRETFSKAKQALIDKRPDVLVLIDYPDFNLALAKKAKSLNIPIFYYVSPQVWAWRRGRVKKIAALVNKMAVLFPFEADIYKDAGLQAEFVGHPVAETLDFNFTKEELKQKLGLASDKPVITLLPGSRPAEIKKHMPVLRETAEILHREMPDMQIVIPLAKESSLTGEILPHYITVVKGRTMEAVACSEVSAVTSGTATLETALLGTPMAVFYKLSPLTYFFGKLLIKVKFISLVNILSDREVVKELIQAEASAENIFSEIKKILQDDKYRQEMIVNLNKIKELMGKKTASARVAVMIGELAGWNDTNA